MLRQSLRESEEEEVAEFLAMKHQKLETCSFPTFADRRHVSNLGMKLAVHSRHVQRYEFPFIFSGICDT